MDVAKKTIWIDLDNSPHVPLFVPIIRYYSNLGTEIILTAREHSQTVELLELAGLAGKFVVLGRHYGKSKLNKIRGLLSRTRQLISYIKGRKDEIAVAVSHGSRSMVLAARWLKIPVITMYDYEFTETGVFNRFSDLVIVPDGIPDAVLDEIGLARGRRSKFPGIKEELYVRNFLPSDGFLGCLLDEHKITAPPEQVYVLLRPPATTANYHSERSDALLTALLRHIAQARQAFAIVVPRTSDQARAIRSLIREIGPDAANCLVLETAIDGLNLAYASDLVISGGGTMNREAALLGIPVYSIFAGRQGVLDASMEREGKITFIRDDGDIAKIALKKRERGEAARYSNGLTDRVERFVIEQIDSFL